MTLTASLTALFLLTLGPAAHADWSFSADKTSLLLEDDGEGDLFVDFYCRDGVLTSDYSSLDTESPLPFPTDASVRLEIAVKGGKRGSFPVVLDEDDDDGLVYGVGDWDARRVLALVSGEAPFVANLRVGKQVEWKESFDAKGYSDLKGDVLAFCPASPQEK
jgi:hypothetical protein